MIPAATPADGAPLLPSERLALEWSLAAPGTAGVHANTLLGRKLRDGRAAPLFAQMRASAAAADEEAAALPPDSRAESALLRELAGSLREAVARVESVTEVLTSDEARPVALVNAHECVAGWRRSLSARRRSGRAGPVLL
mmetsp:Transcript_11833/g.35469  ORF Transcript_11833/g.35469 Transcript_11833/m.35469 type:complete len:140 (-) Transcript_11833:100-519(-)